MKPKTFLDYLGPSMPLSMQFTYAANILAILKLAGELHNLDWTFILIMYVIGFVLRLLRAAINQAKDANSAARSDV